MSAGDKLFGRLLGRVQDRTPALSPALQVHLDEQGRVLQLVGPLRHALLPQADSASPRPLADYVLPHSALSLEGSPSDWQGQSLDLDFLGPAGKVLQGRGWIEPRPGGWLLQLLDIGDLLRGHHETEAREQSQRLAVQIEEQLRLCGLARLEAVLEEQLQAIAQQWHVPCIALAMLDESGRHWVIRSQFTGHSAPRLWQVGQQLPAGLDSLDGSQPVHLAQGYGMGNYPRLQDAFANAESYLVPYSDEQGVAAWLLCGFYPVQQRAAALRPRDWLQLAAALAGPALNRQREQRHRQQLERLESLQDLLGTGWWELLPDSAQLLLALPLSLLLGLEVGRVPLADWRERVHPADREELDSHLQALVEQGKTLLLCVRIQRADPTLPLLWCRIQGQALGHGAGRRVVGFMLDISDIKNQEQQAAAAHARLDNLIASSPAVIYVQRYVEGALQPAFFSASLLPLFGWSLADCTVTTLIEWIHPEDRARYFERCRQLLREGTVRSRYRLRDRQGTYHWLLDEAKLLRDDLGLPVEAVGLWLDITEATLAAEQVRQSEERYRILVEDSPAMICRYRPDLILTFGNQPLASYLECSAQQLPGVDLGSWLSTEQRAAFLERLAQLTPEQPVSSAEISLQLPGREHAWWVWSDRGVFDEQGRLVEIQAVGRDNTEVRRSQQQLTQSAKMATLGEMATGLAHEINQPLNVMRMAIVNVLKRLENGALETDYLLDKLNRIDAQVQRAAKVVDHMRVFGRRSEIEQQPFDPGQAVEGTLSLLAEGLRGKGVEIRLGEITAGLQVRGFVDQLEQVLINLLVNARDALLSKREANRDFQPWIALRTEHDPQWVRFWVEDNGGGIDPRLLERIFEPFFTTKPVGVGTGLGLSVSYGIIDNMGGHLSVGNGPDGARFCIELPLVVG